MNEFPATALREAVKKARAKGYAAGLEAGAKCAEKHRRPYTMYPENWNRAIAKAIRALAKEGQENG